MSYELVKLQSNEGYSYTPQGNRHINFTFNDPSVIDMSKSYVILNTSVVAAPAAALRTATGKDFVLNPAIASFNNSGLLDYKTVSLIRNAKLTSKEVPSMELYSRDVNILEVNKQLYTKDMGDNAKDSITGAGYSVLDNQTRRIKSSVFLNVVNKGTTVSNLGAADLVVPMGDLFQDVGDMMLYPSGLFGEQHIELELENRLGLVDVANTVQSDISVTLTTPADVTDTEAAESDINVPSILRNSDGEQQLDFYVGQPIQITFTLQKNSAGADVNVVAQAVIDEIDYNFEEPKENDALSQENRDDIVKLTFNKTIGSMIGHTAGQTDIVKRFIINSIKTYDGTPTFVVNKAELVLARRRLNPNVVRDYYSQLMKSGMRFGYWSTTSWNLNNATNVNEYFKLNPQAVGFMNLTPTFTGNSPTLFSLKNGLQSYRVTVGDMETTNRDVLVSANNTSGLYKHKVISTLGACGLEPKNLNDNLSQGLNGFVSNLFFAYPVDYLPAVDESLSLKLNMNGNGMPIGPSFLYVKYNKVVNFM
jgi:hypothetical protein